MLKGKKILITGGSGFIGTNLILRLLKSGAKITNVSHIAPKIDFGENVENVIEDLTKTDFSFLDKQFDCIIHLAALVNARLCKNFDDAYKINVEATSKFFDAIKQKQDLKKLKKIVFMSSVVVYANDAKVPLREDAKLDINHDNYSYTKGIDEQLCEKFRIEQELPILTFRLSNIYGPYQEWQNNANIVPQAITQAIMKGKIEIWDDKPIRDWVYSEDAVDAIAKSLESELEGIVNLGTGEGKSVGDVVKIISGSMNVKVKVLNKETTGPKKVICDITKLKKGINWKPKHTLKEGLSKTIEYYKGEIKP